jgi:glucosamine--fructose-6-phosphate aminotransferase (isomerizing)
VCGIVGILYGAPAPVESLLRSLERLEYRGYDSAGIAFVRDGTLQRIRSARARRSVSEIREQIGDMDLTGVAIGHTRWATHGRPSESNAHPHTDCHERVAVVHNGIIENWSELRAELESCGHVFRSETDTEVVAHLVEQGMAEGLGFSKAFERAVARLSGSYALAAVCADEPESLLGARCFSPLLVGRGPRGLMLASDLPAMVGECNEYAVVPDGAVVVVGREGVSILGPSRSEAAGSVEFCDLEVSLQDASKGGYPSYMLKEIFEQPHALRDTLAGRSLASAKGFFDEVRLGEEMIPREAPLHLVGCGSSYNASLLAAYLLRPYLGYLPPVSLASEFRYFGQVSGSVVYGLVSQSGETADTLACAEAIKAAEAVTIAVTNVVGSGLARLADACFYTRAGPEIGVAATKTFTAQVLALWLIGRFFSGVSSEEPRELAEVPAAAADVLRLYGQGALRSLAPSLARHRTYFYIGRGLCYPLALEGALKLKEIAYLHAEGYPAGELKHGPIALIDEDSLVVVLAEKGTLPEKTASNAEEVRSRGARLVIVTNSPDPLLEPAPQDVVLTVPGSSALAFSVSAAVVMQLLAHDVARYLGHDVDRPRNLAKTVTVE